MAWHTEPSMRLLTGSEDGTVVCWSASGVAIARAAHDGPVHSVCFGAAGGFCSASLDGTAVVRDASGAELHRISHEKGVRAVCWAEDCTWTGDLGGYAKCTRGNGEQMHSWQPHHVPVNSIAFTSASRPCLLVAARDGLVSVWDAQLVQSLFTYTADSNAVNSVAGRGQLAATGGVEAVVRILDIRIQSFVHALGSGANWAQALRSNGDVAEAAKIVYASRGHSFAVTGVCFVDEAIVASSGADRKVLMWDLRQPRQPSHCIGHELAVLGVASAGRCVFSSSDDMSIRQWSLDGDPLASMHHVHEGPIFSIDAALVDVPSHLPAQVWSAM